MQRVTATRAKSNLAQILQDASTHIVIIESRGKPSIAAMPEKEAVLCALCAYASGHIPRRRVMQLLGITWYGHLKDALKAFSVSMDVDATRHRKLVDTTIALLGDELDTSIDRAAEKVTTNRTGGIAHPAAMKVKRGRR